MIDYKIENLIDVIGNSTTSVVLFGASDYGELALFALRQHGVDVMCFCDSSENKQGEEYLGLKIISPGELINLAPDVHVFISSNSFTAIIPQLEKLEIVNFYNCVSLFEQTDFSKGSLSIQLAQVNRRVALHKGMFSRLEDQNRSELSFAAIDIVVTEACSLKCIDCSNLMQYYEKPQNSDLEILLTSIDKMFACIDHVGEVRVLGGEPFMNKQIHHTIDKLVSFDSIDNVVIYTNGTIVPKNENLTCLQNDKVIVSITDYGELSRNHDKLIEMAENNGIAYKTEVATEWTDSGRIKYRERSTDELADMFSKCCVRDIMTLLNGKIYRCPFSANATNLKAVPFDSNDVINLSNETLSLTGLKQEMLDLYQNRAFLSACTYCNGRDYRTAKVEAGVQAPKRLEYEKIPME